MKTNQTKMIHLERYLNFQVLILKFLKITIIIQILFKKMILSQILYKMKPNTKREYIIKMKLYH